MKLELLMCAVQSRAGTLLFRARRQACAPISSIGRTSLDRGYLYPGFMLSTYPLPDFATSPPLYSSQDNAPYASPPVGGIAWWSRACAAAWGKFMVKVLGSGSEF